MRKLMIMFVSHLNNNVIISNYRRSTVISVLIAEPSGLGSVTAVVFVETMITY